MKKRILCIGILLAFVPSTIAKDVGSLTSTADLRSALEDDSSLGTPFSLEGQVVFRSGKTSTIFKDSSGFILLYDEQACTRIPNTRLKVTGFIRRGTFGMLHPAVEQSIAIGQGKALPPIDVSIADYTMGKCDMSLVRLKGRMQDVFRDEIDLSYLTIILQSESDTVIAAVYTTSPNRLDELIGTEVTLSGFCCSREYGARRMIKRTLVLPDLEAIQPTTAFNPDIFAAPPLLPGEFPDTRPTRRRTAGRVIAVWNKDSLLLQPGSGTVMRVTLFDQAPPAYGTDVEVSGFVETDLYRINLSHAKWRPSTTKFPLKQSIDTKPSFLHFNQTGTPGINPTSHGQVIRLQGTVLDTPTEGGCFKIKWGNDILWVDANEALSVLNSIVPGCRVQIEGVCIMETENWRPGNAFPHIQRILIAARKSDDVRVLARPPWWTPGRLLVLVGALVAVILGIFAWNVALRRRAERRGQELADEQLAHVSSELKVMERTRLAVELHDSLSQTLTGISMGIDSALDIAGDTSKELKKQLNYTSKTVEACRTELRNCLWDLRSQALEESDMNAAIQLALSQIVSKTALNVRFAVPRTRLSDKTAHTILRIIRELATNAVRHGHASAIKIAGCIDNGKLHFSVADNGTGFDPEHAAGVAEGHFGLEGIRERVDRLDGEVDISSSPGHGTKVTAAFDIPSAKMEEGHDNG